MSDGTALVPRKRLRTWIVLFAFVLGLLLACGVGMWLWLLSDGDLGTIEEEAKACGINLEPVKPPLTTPVRLAQARRVEAIIRVITVPGGFSEQRGFPPSDEFRKAHQEVPSSAIRDVATAIIDLGSEPVVVERRELRLNYWSWGRLLHNRILVSEPEELELCLAASQVRIEMGLRDRHAWWGWRELQTFIGFLPYRMPDQQEHLRPIAEWLETMATKLLAETPQLAEQNLAQDIRFIRDGGEMLIKERGMSLPGYLWLADGLVLVIAMRKERARILKDELGWQQFLTAHPNQPRVWMDEANRRFAALGSERSWLSINTHREVLFMQHPTYLRRLVGTILHARLFAAELRGLPWPVDVLDPAGKRLRRWEKDGRLIGAYSVGPNGIDDGGNGVSDITLRLYPEPAGPAPAK